MVTSKQLLMDETMKIVAEKKMLGFSMRQVTKAARTSEALLYKYFETRENLLLQCYLDVDREIAAVFDDEKIPEFLKGRTVPKVRGLTVRKTDSVDADASEVNAGELIAYIKHLWMKYFTFLVKNGYKTLFYFEYRDSLFSSEVGANERVSGQTYFKAFTDVVMRLYILAGMTAKGQELLWTYILDVTGLFAKRVIRGDFKRTKGTSEDFEEIWKLVYGGIAAAMNVG